MNTRALAPAGFRPAVRSDSHLVEVTVGPATTQLRGGNTTVIKEKQQIKWLVEATLGLAEWVGGV
ncbi:MAG: hypothetical protein ABIV28_04785 [Longimicrobiales bacterium]